MNLKRLTDRPDWLRKVTQAVAFSIDATDVQEKLEDLGLHVTVDEIDASRDGGTFTIEGGENETSIVLTLQLTRIEHDFSRIDIGAPMPTASAESRPATPDEHTGPCGYVEDGGCGHRSDCAQHNEPAMPNGPCDCGRPLTTRRGADPMMLANVGRERQFLVAPIPEDAERALAEVFTAHAEEIDAALEPWGIRARDLLAPAWTVGVTRSMLEEMTANAPRHDHERVTVAEAREELADLGIDYTVEGEKLAPTYPLDDGGGLINVTSAANADSYPPAARASNAIGYVGPIHPLCGTAHPDYVECPADV